MFNMSDIIYNTLISLEDCETIFQAGLGPPSCLKPSPHRLFRDPAAQAAPVLEPGAPRRVYVQVMAASYRSQTCDAHVLCSCHLLKLARASALQISLFFLVVKRRPQIENWSRVCRRRQLGMHSSSDQQATGTTRFLPPGCTVPTSTAVPRLPENVGPKLVSV